VCLLTVTYVLGTRASSLQERAKKRALESLRRHLSSRLPQCEKVVGDFAAVIEEQRTAPDAADSMDTLVSSARQLTTVMGELRTALPR
jgi:hypothetical protein